MVREFFSKIWRRATHPRSQRRHIESDGMARQLTRMNLHTLKTSDPLLKQECHNKEQIDQSSSLPRI